jgi:hypothetical protein
MVTKPETRNRSPRQIELDESLGTPGLSFMRVRPGGKPQIRSVSIRLRGAPDRDSILLFALVFPGRLALLIQRPLPGWLYRHLRPLRFTGIA